MPSPWKSFEDKLFHHYPYHKGPLMGIILKDDVKKLPLKPGRHNTPDLVEILLTRIDVISPPPPTEAMDTDVSEEIDTDFSEARADVSEEIDKDVLKARTNTLQAKASALKAMADVSEAIYSLRAYFAIQTNDNDHPFKLETLKGEEYKKFLIKLFETFKVIFFMNEFPSTKVSEALGTEFPRANLIFHRVTTINRRRLAAEIEIHEKKKIME